MVGWLPSRARPLPCTTLTGTRVPSRAGANDRWTSNPMSPSRGVARRDGEPRAARRVPVADEIERVVADGESADLIGWSSDPGPAARRRIGQLGPPGQVQRTVAEPLINGLAQRAVRDDREHPG